MSDLFTLKCDKISDHALVGFRGKETISRPYEFQFYFTVPIGTDVKQAIGARATIRGARRDSEPVIFHGVIAQVALLHQPTNQSRRADTDRALYRALLVPRLWLARRFQRSHVFTGKNVKEFLQETLEAAGLVSDEFRFDFDAGSHPTEELIVQYRESHLHFFDRWCEREGLYYYFEQKEDAANEVLVIVEDKAKHQPFPGTGKVGYFPVHGDDATAPEGLHDLGANTRWLPKTVTLADYDYLNPTHLLTADSEVTKDGAGVIRDYGYRMFLDAEAKRLSKIKAESIGCRETTLHGSGTRLGPRAGYTLTLEPRPDAIEQEEWLAIEVEHTATVRPSPGIARLTGLSSTHVYGMKLLAIPADVQYRAPQTTEWPRIHGFENGVIMGDAESPYAQIDDEGRYLVRFAFDASDLADGKVSTRIRMLQPHGGTKEGHHFPLRKGTEVMVGFLGGDPDRPFIAGVVPNAQKPSVVVQRNYTQNIIRTGSNNELVLEDLQGKEYVYMHTPNQNAGLYMGQPSPRAFVDPDSAKPGLETTIDGAQVSFHLNTDGSAGLSVGGSMWTDITSNECIFVGENVSHGYAGTFKLQVGGNTTEHYYADHSITVDTTRTETVVGTVGETYGPLSTTVNGNAQLEIQSTFLHKVGAKNDDNYGSWGTWVKGGWTGDATQVGWTVGGDVKIEASALALIKAPTVHFNVSDKFSNTAKPKALKLSPITVDFYGTKTSTITMKFDVVGVSLGATAVKTETVKVSMSRTGAKAEATGLSAGYTGIKFDKGGSSNSVFLGEVKIEGLSMKTGGFINRTFGGTKI
ncbi:MAG: type VI secretion system tip protein TssI/VgrG [Polyangiaceae bacterium]